MILPVLLIGAGVAAILVIALASDDGPVPVHEPDLPATPGSTRYKRIDAILPQLRMASASSRVPLGVMVGWIARESGGRLDEVPKPLKGEPDGERGLFQLTPSESKSLGLSPEDHKRLSTDLQFSINAGLMLIAKYMGKVDRLGVAAPGSSYYWRLVKLMHTMGSGAAEIIVKNAKAVGAARSWEALEEHALDNERQYLSETKHSPSKWFPLVDKVYEIGAPFGFGGADVIVGGEAFPDIPDPLDCVKKS